MLRQLFSPTAKRPTRLVAPAGVLVLVLALAGCSGPTPPLQSGRLGFDRDTIRFDTLFTTIQSPDERLVVTNREAAPLRIARVRLAGGSQSPFELLFNGQRAQEIEDVELAAGDSLLAYVRFRGTALQDAAYADELVFELDGQTDRLPLRAYVLDAYFYQNETLPCTHTLPTDKPHVVDGILYVPANCHLTIPAGAELAFTARKDSGFNLVSSLVVDGRLTVQGAPGNPARFRSLRQDGSFARSPGQWRGIILRPGSHSNRLEYALVENASVGLEVDSIAPGNATKALVRNSRFARMSNFGVLGLSFSPQLGLAPNIRLENVEIHHCGQAGFAGVWGGWYQLRHVTIYNDGRYQRRTGPGLFFSDYLDLDTVLNIFPGRLDVLNSYIWGSEEDEFAFDLSAEAPPGVELAMRYTLVRSTDTVFTGDSLWKVDAGFNYHTGFVDRFEEDYRLQASSPAVNRGLSIPQEVPDDIDGLPRYQLFDSLPDLGAHELKFLNLGGPDD